MYGKATKPLITLIQVLMIPKHKETVFSFTTYLTPSTAENLNFCADGQQKGKIQIVL